MGLINLITKSFFKNAEETLNAVERKLDSIDFDAELNRISEVLTTASEHLNAELNRIAERIKTTDDTWEVDVPFDINSHVIKVKVENGELDIKVFNEDETNGTDKYHAIIKIPDNVNVSSMKQKYDKENKQAILLFKKVSA